MFPILLGGCEPFFVEKSRKNDEKSKISKKHFCTISQWHIPYHLGLEITYFCVKFQRLTPNSFQVYNEHTDRQTEIEIYIYAYVYVY